MCLPMTQTAATGASAQAGLEVREYLLQWLAHARGRVRAVTYEGYEVLLRRHAAPFIGHLQLGDVSPLEIQRLYAQLLAPQPGRRAIGDGTVLNLHLVLTQAFAQA